MGPCTSWAWSGEGQRQADPAVAQQLADLDHVTRDLDPVEGVQQRAVQLPRLEPGEVGSDAEVRAVPEPEMRAGVRPLDVVGPGIREDLCVPVPGVVEQVD